MLVMEIGFTVYECENLKLETVVNELISQGHPLKNDHEV